MEASLVFPHQLFFSSSALSKNRKVFILRDPLFFKDRKYLADFHKSKLLLHLLSTNEYKEELIKAGYNVTLIDSEDLSGDDYLKDIIIKYGLTNIHYCDPVDFIINSRLDNAIKNTSVVSNKYDSMGFMLTNSEVEEEFFNKKSYFMASFYKKQRKRFKILMSNDGSPLGGKWSFDQENRKKLPKTIHPPELLKINYNNKEIVRAKHYIEQNYKNNPGSFDSFNYPIDRENAIKALHYFLKTRFEKFGTYEDAIAKNETFLFHSVITPYLNIGLITPKQVIDEALSYADENSIPLNSLEGFVRQIIGWREFMRGIYISDGVKQRNSNFWNYTNDIPSAFYNATTGIGPLDDTIKKCLDNAYVHHIERLMILGNIMLLLRIKPDSVYKWFMELFIDSYDWVMVPNVYGMSQFADGGLLATKPYISGSNYILKMSDYKKGDWCEVWDSLYWRFININRDFFRKNPRMNMMVSMYDRKDKNTKLRLMNVAEDYTDKLFS